MMKSINHSMSLHASDSCAVDGRLTGKRLPLGMVSARYIWAVTRAFVVRLCICNSARAAQGPTHPCPILCRYAAQCLMATTVGYKLEYCTIVLLRMSMPAMFCMQYSRSTLILKKKRAKKGIYCYGRCFDGSRSVRPRSNRLYRDRHVGWFKSRQRHKYVHHVCVICINLKCTLLVHPQQNRLDWIGLDYVMHCPSLLTKICRSSI
jgi:hypothetical protein